jgi:hypothetical protein
MEWILPSGRTNTKVGVKAIPASAAIFFLRIIPVETLTTSTRPSKVVRSLRTAGLIALQELQVGDSTKYIIARAALDVAILGAVVSDGCAAADTTWL